MYGWGARIGLIVPSANVTIEPEYERFAPDGVSIHTARMRLTEANPEALEATLEEVDRAATLVSDAQVDILGYACTMGSVVTDFEEIEETIERRTGVNTITIGGAVKRALDAHQVNSVVVTTPYNEELNEIERSYLEESGYRVLEINGLDADPVTGMGHMKYGTAYTQAKNVYRPDADAIFISCADYKTMELIESLEADLETPVVTSNQALLWNMLTELEIDTASVPAGTLFETKPADRRTSAREAPLQD